LSKQPQKKDKGKAIQTAADYQLQIATQNQLTIPAITIQSRSHKSIPVKHSRFLCH